MKRDIFLRLPQPMAVLLLSAVLDLTAAHIVYPLARPSKPAPQPTSTVSHHALDVLPYPPAPTSPPRFTADLLRRQDLNTVCGYLGGDPNLPATCDLGSHCVVDIQHGAIGCCPDAEAVCTTGIFTECIDGNSPPQTEVNPYVFTCQGGDVCYRNLFEGGFFQFGCGTASDLATSVFATATGITQPLTHPTVTFSFTESAETLSAPTTLGTVTVPSSVETPTSTELPSSAETPTSTELPSSAQTPTSSELPTSVTIVPHTSTEANSRTSNTERSSAWTSSTGSSNTASSSTSQGASSTSSISSSSSGSSTTSSSSSSINSSSSTSTSSNTSSNTSSSSSSSSTSSTTAMTIISPTSNLSSATAVPSAPAPPSRDHTGAIVGGTISGVAGLVAAAALGTYLWRRRRRGRGAGGGGGNRRLGPGGGGGGSSEYISPMQQQRDDAASYHGSAAGFEPLHQDQDGWETGMTPAVLAATGGGGPYPGHPGRDSGYLPPPSARTGYDYHSPHYPAGYFGEETGGSAAAAAAAGSRPSAYSRPEVGDHIPLTREIDDFSKGFHDALGRIGEEDEYDSSPNSGTGVNEGNGVHHGANGGGHGNGYDDEVDGRPLWQRQRRQSRNLMWM